MKDKEKATKEIPDEYEGYQVPEYCKEEPELFPEFCGAVKASKKMIRTRQIMTNCAITLQAVALLFAIIVLTQLYLIGE